MSDYDKLLKLIDDERVQAGLSLNNDIGVTFTLGQTRHVWRYGTLSDGHEKLTASQRFYQANREIYNVANNIEDSRYSAMEAKADLIDAETALGGAITEADKLRYSAASGKAKARLRRALEQAQDAVRGLDELCKVRAELAPAVMAQYPEGVEQAEPDNWRAVAEYRLAKAQTPGLPPAILDSVPMSPQAKAELGVKYGRIDAIAPLMLANQDVLASLPEQGPEALPAFVAKMKESS